MTTKVRRALMAVYDKTGAADLARALVERGVEVVSSGGTAAALRDAGVPVTAVEDVTGSPEMLDGRVKTLHPAIHAAILADRRRPEHVDQLATHGIEPFDLVVVNLYPFRETVASGASFDETIEQIDIGGPAMVRAAAKNHASVAVVVDPVRYEEVIAEIDREDGVTDATRHALAAEAFAHTAAYDAAVASWFSEGLARDGLPSYVGSAFEKVTDLRYGENPHQRGALYPGPVGFGIPRRCDGAARARACPSTTGSTPTPRTSSPPPCPAGSAVIVKHNNPCGAAARSSVAESYRAAFACDEVSAFGGIVALNGAATREAASAMEGVFTEVVIAPSFDPEALSAFAERPNLRVVTAPLPDGAGLDVRPMPGGALVQDRDLMTETRDDWTVVSSRPPTDGEWDDLALAWIICWRVKSNAIVFVRDRATVGVGAGQMSRVDSAWIAARKAGDRAAGSVVASDAFFPFPDALEVAAKAGCTAVIHPGGSKGDDDVLAAAEAAGMAVVVTGTRHFRH